MTTSQNGYSANDRALIRSATVAGTDVQVSVRKGPAGDLLLYAAARWHREVEPLRHPDGVLDCWGYAERTVRGSAEVSNHASGTALDLRARAHPLGTDPAHNFTTGEVRAISRIVMDCAPCLRWGGNYTGRKDGMHIEIVADERQCAQTLARLTGAGRAVGSTRVSSSGGDEDMPLSDQDVEKIARRSAELVWGFILENAWRDRVSAAQVIVGTEARTADVQQRLPKK